MSYNIALWIDDVRPIPQDYKDKYNVAHVVWCHSVNEAIYMYDLWGNDLEDEDVKVTIIDIDHDAGDYANDGGDYIRFLDWMEMYHQQDISKLIWKIHSMNPVGIQNMLAILRRNGVKC